MCAVDDMRQKALGSLEFSSLPTYSSQMFRDDRGSFGLVSMKYQTNIGQADPHALARAQHPQSAHVFLAVIAVTRR